MGNSKSKKVKICQSDTENEPRERINSIKTDLTEATTDSNQPTVVRNENEVSSELDGVKEIDNASSASTVEVLDDK